MSGLTRKILDSMLRRRGYEVQEAGTGREAINLAQSCRFDLLISDVGLTDMSGWDLQQEIRKHCPGIPAIAMSGHGSEERGAANLPGFDFHLIKPATMAQIETAIATALDK